MDELHGWSIEETKSSDFGDKRLNKRFGSLLSSLASSPNKSIPASCKGWAETLAAYRFLNHDDVTELGILAPHKKATLERIKNEKIVLIPQDTTQIDFTGRKSLSGIGYLTKESGQGFYLHPCIAVTPSRCCLGVLDIQTWTRDELNSKGKRKQRPIEEKESYRWIKGYQVANEIAHAAPNTIIVAISDREGDIYEALEKIPSEENKAFWLVRCNHNRVLLNEKSGGLNVRLKEKVGMSAPIGHLEFKIPAGTVNNNSCQRHFRTERIVKQEIRVCTVFLKPPQRKGKKLESIAINVVHCKEVKPPSGEEPIEWYLITSYPIKDAEAAMKIVNWYLCRWVIEMFFKVLKTGCKVEELQFETLKGTINCITLYMIVAWRILYITMLGRSCPDIDCNVVFDDNEWRAVYSVVKKKRAPKKVPKLGEMISMIAKLGGFLGRKSDGEPGAQVMWIGIQRMRDFTLAWETFHSLNSG
jgi:hypothetical protein